MNIFVNYIEKRKKDGTIKEKYYRAEMLGGKNVGLSKDRDSIECENLGEVAEYILSFEKQVGIHNNEGWSLSMEFDDEIILKERRELSSQEMSRLKEELIKKLQEHGAD